jgi:hypothetical protein
VLVSLLLAVAVFQTPAQGPKLTSVQAGSIVRTVADYLIPPDRPLGTHQPYGRTVVYDRERTQHAFEPLVGSVKERDIALALPALLMSRQKAVVCTPDPKDCTVARDGVFIAIDHIEPGPRADEYLVVATVLWGEPHPGGGHRLHGGTYHLTVGLAGGKWKHWSVLHSAPKPGL